MRMISSALSKYNCYTKKKPLTSISITTGVILGMGDILEQCIEKRNNPQKTFEIRRVLKMSAYGFVIYGPFCSYWYNSWLPRLVPMVDSSAVLKPICMKILYDEVLQSSFFYTSFLYSMTRLEGGTHQQGYEKCKKDFLRCYLADLAVWPWVQFINFRYVPPHLQAIVVTGLTVFWSAYISYVQHS